MGRLACCTMLSAWLLCTAAASAQYGATARVAAERWDDLRGRDRVDAREAERAAASNVGDALQEASGVTVQRTSSASASPIVRGLTGNRVLLLVDDLRLNDSLMRAGGHALLNLIDPESVDHLEVIRGPASVMHGSDALGGVVRVVTKRAGAPTRRDDRAWGTAYLRGASAERALRVQAGAGATLGRFGLRASGGRGHAGRLQRGGGLGVQPYTGHDDWSFASQLELIAAPGQRVGLAHQSGHLFDVPRSDLSQPDDLRITKALDRESAVLDYAARLPAPGAHLRGRVGLTLRREWRRRVRPEEIRDEHDRVLGQQLGIDLVAPPWGGASLALGVQAALEQVRSRRVTGAADGDDAVIARGRYLDGSHHDSYAAHALLTQPLSDRLSLLAGGRLTFVHVRAPDDPLFATEAELGAALDRWLVGPVGSLGLRHAPLPGVLLSGSLLGGFRAPNLEDLQAFGGGARGFIIPNAGLDEERAWTLEGSLKLKRAGLRLEAHLWGSLLSGLIVRVPASLRGMDEIDGEPVLQRRNASRARMVGAELELAHHFDSGVVAGASAWLTRGEVERRDEGGDALVEPAPKLPPPLGSLRIGYEPRDGDYWLLGLLTAQAPTERLSASDRRDVRICPRGPEACQRVAGYVDVTLRAGVALGAQLDLSLALENALDAGYRTFASGAHAPGRSLVVAVRGTAP